MPVAGKSSPNGDAYVSRKRITSQGAPLGRRWEYLLAYLIPLLVLTAAFYLRGIYPFGDTSVLYWDMKNQYVSYFGWLSDVLRGSGSLVYSADKGFGGGMLALVAYYLSSPFNFLAALFDSAHTPELLCVLTLVKIPAAGVTCYAYLRRVHGSGTLNVLLGCAYALCGWVVGECSNIMWIDGVIMLPLIAIGVTDLVEGRRRWLLFVTVACAIVFNWYTAYMDCLFAIILFFVLELASLGWKPRGRRKELLHDSGRFALVMVLGVGASMVLFLPAILGLLQGKGATSGLGDLTYLSIMGNPSDDAAYLSIGTTCSSSELRQPMLYLSAIALVPALAFLVDSFKRKRPVFKAALVVLALVGGGLFLSTIDIIWTGFMRSTSFYFRYVFVLEFVVVGMAARGIRSLSQMERRERLRLIAVSAAVLLFVVLLACANISWHNKELWPSAMGLVVEVLEVGVSALLLAGVLCRGDASQRKGSGLVLRACLPLLVCSFLVAQTYDCWSVFGRYSQSCSGYTTYVEQMQDLSSSLQDGSSEQVSVSQNGTTYMGRGTSSTNEQLVYGFQGPAHYSSTMESTSADLLIALGYSRDCVLLGTYGAGPYLVPDSLLSIDYVIDTTQGPDTTEVAASDAVRDGTSVWSNDDALPFGYGISSTAAAATLDSTADPFSNQELMVSDMSATDASGLYTAATTADDTTSGSTRTFTVTVEKDGPLYLYTPLPDEMGFSCSVSVTPQDGSSEAKSWSNMGSRFLASVVYVGDYTQGQVLTVSMTPTSPNDAPTNASSYSDTRTASQVLIESSADDLVEFQTLDTDAFKQAVSSLDTTGFTMDSFEDGAVSCDFDADEDECLLLNVPYDSDWTATVDGQEVQVRQCYGGLSGIDVTAGSHHIEMTYHPRGVIPGICISVASILAFAGWRLVSRRRASHAA